MADNPTIVIGSLKDEALRKSIDELVEYVDRNTSDMAASFVVSIDMMKGAMKDFAITQKVSVSLMKQAWRDMSASFDAMVRAQESATSGGGGKSSSGGTRQTYPENTVGGLEELIRTEEKRRKEMELGTGELRKQNEEIDKLKSKLKGETTADTKQLAKAFQKEIGNVTSLPSKSLSDAQEKLRRLRDLLQKMKGVGFLSESQINRVKNAIDSVETKIERIKKKWGQKGTQPQTLTDVLGMDENSVENIAKKMQALKKVQIDPTNTYEIKRLGDEYQRLGRLQNEWLGRSIQQTKSNNYLAQSFGYIRNRIVYALTLGAMTNFVKQIYEVRGQYELLERSLGVLLNSFERGSQVFQKLNAMAIESPFTLMELAGAAKQLTAYNFAANEVVDTTRRLADISAALGVPMERLTYNLGQIRAQTVLNARDARDFANAGLPIVKSLSDYYTELEGKIVSTGDVYDRMSKKMVSYNDVMAVINKMTDQGGKFFEFQAKQAETLRVQMANLTLAWNNALNEMGKNNQGLLTMPVKALKALLQNWSDINRVLKNLILTIGFLKVAQMVAINQQMSWAKYAGATAKQMGFLANSINNVIKSLGSMASNPWNWVFVGVIALTDLIGKMRAAHNDIVELNDELRKSAEEASQSNLDFLNNKGNQATRKLAIENKLSAEQGEKAWEALEEQISTSAMSANMLLGELWAIDDINERVRKGFDYAERIQKAQAAMQDLKDTTIDLTHDKGWWGMFGEGLVSDLKDLKAELNGIGGQSDMFTPEGKVNANLGRGFAEYQEELEVTAQSIKDFIDAYNITDPLQINEILSRVKAQIKQRNPEIKGELATLFDVTLDQRVNYLVSGAVDKNTSLWDMFLERLKHNYSNAFQDITSDIYKETGGLSKKQQAAVDENLEYFKKTMPYYYDTIKSMVDDASQLRINIGVTFNVQKLTDFQNEVNKRLKDKFGTLTDQFNAFLPSQNDNLTSWVTTQQEAIAKLAEENKKYDKDNTEWSKRRKAENNTEIEQRKHLLDLFKQSYAKEKKNGGSKKDPVLDTLKEEIRLVEKLQGDYDKLTKAGASQADALENIRGSYGKTIRLLNAQLNSYGLPQIDIAQLITGKDPHKALEHFKRTLDTLVSKGMLTLERSKELEAVVEKFTLSAKTYDLDKITKGLNNELDKLKDEYELAVELDANPELGDMFADMFDIDTEGFPKTIDDYMARVQGEFDKAASGFDKPLDVFKASAKDWEEWGKAVGLGEEALKSFNAKFVEAQGVAKKWATDIVNNTKKLEYDLAELNDKIAIKEKEQVRLREQIEKEKNEITKHYLELTYQNNEKAINELRSQALSLMPEYARVFNSIAEYSAGVARRLQQDLMKVYDNAKFDSANKTWTLTSGNGTQTILDDTAYRREREKLTKEMRKSQAPLQKIKEAFKPSDANGVVDWAKGVELIGQELQKVGSIVSEIGNFAEKLGFDRGTVEVINDVANSINGVATMAQGIGQIASGDYIGGAASVLSGAFSAIGTWFDNADNRISDKIKESERAVKRLEYSYIDLQQAVDKAYGTATIGAKQAALANKELQLAELQRQIQLEKSRSAKNRDEDKILDLQREYKELYYEIKNGTTEIVDELMGTDVAGFAENMVSSMIQAFKQGEDYMKTFEESFETMIDNMIMKSIVSRVVAQYMDALWEDLDRKINERTKEESDAFAKAQNNALRISNMSDEEVAKELGLPWGLFGMFGESNDVLQKIIEDYRKAVLEEEEAAKERLAAASAFTSSDVDYIMGEVTEIMPELGEKLKAILGEYYKFGESSETQLSALQQGISQISEQTANALEAYANSISQQAYLRNDLLVQIRDTIMSFDMDVQLGVFSQMLLQLQNNYIVMQSMQSMMEGWTTPSGQGIRVELIS